ncbi:GNAT family N-acetyltransferase [Sphingomonas sp. ac-8]|uniref:GNAT family N-acetyltransferase n=1 Tax=Sphingomonas sp. ac-8 TaxID=3242977 RepID=UPI003A7FD413
MRDACAVPAARDVSLRWHDEKRASSGQKLFRELTRAGCAILLVGAARPAPLPAAGARHYKRRMTIRLDTVDAPTPEDREAVIAPLRDYNERMAGPAHTQPLAILLRDSNGQPVGGLWGRSGYDWLFVEYLAIPDSLRGHGFGAALMAEAERVAQARGCCGIWLDTFAFQARGFYEKLGFTVFGTLEDHPRGSRRFFLSKRF